MTRTTRSLAAAAIATAVAVLPASPAAAHGGASDASVTSNYRTSVTDVPQVDGLTVDIVDIDGTIELTWTGAGTLTVAGYENEPYLRFGDTGVFQNRRSPRDLPQSGPVRQRRSTGVG